jgi:hypothetical protein
MTIRQATEKSFLQNTRFTMYLSVLPLQFAIAFTVFTKASSLDQHDDTETKTDDGFLPPCNPPWPPSYNINDSLITMQVNLSGLSSPRRGAEFGIVSYDWSNMKDIWAASKPMTCEELMVEQAVATKEAAGLVPNNPKIFVYRNIVKALPWFTSVRKKLDDPQFAGFFLKFDPSKKGHYHVPDCAAENAMHCSVFYHDQLQTPEVPTADNPTPDGSCSYNRCDCGSQPCGEYLFDHRNGTMLREWIVNEVILGATALGHPYIDGLFLDDFWCSDLLCANSNNAILGCPCNDPVQGPTEIDANSQSDMGLSDADIADITLEWNETMGRVQRAILNHNAYTWSLIPGQANANAYPTFLSSNMQQCIAACRKACKAASTWQQYPVLFGFTVTNATVLLQFNQDLAFFLLARGPYAYAGWGQWGMTWPFNPDPQSHGALPPLPDGVPLPPALFADYGTPQELCYESPDQIGVFHRRWSHATVELDCNTFVGTISKVARNEFSEAY